MTAHPNWLVAGHDWAVNFLRTSLINRRARHAYLITGAASVGKSTLAHAFAMALNCTHEDISARPCLSCRSCHLIQSGNHPDLVYSQTDDKSGQLKIDTLREVMRNLAFKPYESRYRVAILHDFNQAQARTQDAILKTLEEPPPQAVLILIATSLDNIQATILSRCQVLNLRPAPLQDAEVAFNALGATPEQARLLARLSGGRIGWGIQALQDNAVLTMRETLLNQLVTVMRGSRLQRFQVAEELAQNDKIALRYMLEIWQTYWRDVMLASMGQDVVLCNVDRQTEVERMAQLIPLKAALQGLKATRSLLYGTLYTNANLRLAFETLFLDYPFARA